MKSFKIKLLPKIYTTPSNNNLYKTHKKKIYTLFLPTNSFLTNIKIQLF